MKKIFNLSNLYGAAALLFLFMLPAGLVEAEMYVSALACVGAGCVCAYRSMKEDGQIK